jgi:phosphoglycolate phosphatase
MASAFPLVVFDLDGTLVDSAPDLCTAVGLALSEFHLPPPSVPEVRAMIGEGQRVLIERALRHGGGSPDLLDPVLLRFRVHYSEHLVEQTQCYPGVVEGLRALPAEVRRGVATNKPGHWARQIVKDLGIGEQFEWVLGEDDVGRRKPDPLLLHEICRRAGVPPEQALYVGDSAIDLATARAAGATMALCTYGYLDPTTRAALLDPAADRPRYLFERFGDLLPVLGVSGGAKIAGS